MKNPYTVEYQDGTSQEYSRKDLAIKAAEATDKSFLVKSPSGAVVHTTIAVDAAPAPTPAPKAAKVGSPIAYTKDHGAKRFYPAQAAGALALAEARGVTATADPATQAVLVTGSKTDFRKFAKEVSEMWTLAWAAFKVWKTENKERRAQQWLTNDGKREMFKDESEFLTSFANRWVKDHA